MSCAGWRTQGVERDVSPAERTPEPAVHLHAKPTMAARPIRRQQVEGGPSRPSLFRTLRLGRAVTLKEKAERTVRDGKLVASVEKKVGSLAV